MTVSTLRIQIVSNILYKNKSNLEIHLTEEMSHNREANVIAVNISVEKHIL